MRLIHSTSEADGLRELSLSITAPILLPFEFNAPSGRGTDKTAELAPLTQRTQGQRSTKKGERLLRTSKISAREVHGRPTCKYLRGETLALTSLNSSTAFVHSRRTPGDAEPETKLTGVMWGGRGGRRDVAESHENPLPPVISLPRNKLFSPLSSNYFECYLRNSSLST